MPGELRKETHRIATGQDSVLVDFYYRPGERARPRAVVSHGFLANKENMAHWGVMLAREGFVVAVPTHPALIDPQRNAEMVSGLVRARPWPVQTTTNDKVLLVGFSKGGLETLLAAADLGDAVDAWVGLDPVDRYHQGRAEAGRIRAAGLAVLADPVAFNDRGNAYDMLSTYGGTLRIVPVAGAGHLDAVSPGGRRKFENFRREVLVFLQSVFRTSEGKG